MKSSLLNPSTLCLQQKFRQVNNWVQNSDQRLEIYFSNQVIEFFLFFIWRAAPLYPLLMNFIIVLIEQVLQLYMIFYVYKLHETQHELSNPTKIILIVKTLYFQVIFMFTSIGHVPDGLTFFVLY